MDHMDFSQYMPHGMCLLWKPWLVSLWVVSDLLIVLSYFAIPFALLKVTRARPDLRHRGIVLLFAGFITLCGITHAMSIVTLWVPIYPPMGWVKLATGLVSMATAVVLFRLVPVFKAIPSPSQLQAANADLRDAIAAHEATLADLRRMRDELEERVADRTSELERANATIAVAMREAVHRSTNLLTVVIALARQSARGANGLEGFLKAFTGRIEALSRATASVGEDGPAGGAELGRVLRVQLDPLVLTFGDRLRIEGPPVQVGPSAAQQFSLVVHELGTNAGKYGALAGEEGRVDLSWTTEEGEDGSQLRLVWRESGVPMDNPRAEPPGFGTRLLTTIVPGVLGGKAERSFERGGLRYELEVPLAALAPASYAPSPPDGPGQPCAQPA
jgi:two-component sensor histidine kinase